MYRELRIAVYVVLILFIYGLMSLFSSGGFAVPFFLSKLVLLAVSIVFFLLNVKNKGWGYLLFSVLAMLSFVIGDGTSVNLITKGGQRQEIFELLDNSYLIAASFIVFFGFFYTAIIPLYKVLIKKWLALVFLGMLTGALTLLILESYLLFQVVFSFFLAGYFSLIFRKDLPEKSVLNVLSALFLLQLLLELFKYLL